MYREIENTKVYINEDDSAIVVTGIPGEESEHNCDVMGCTQEHVIIKAMIYKLGL